jgi:5-deoxy-5-amino-3-dehydroquinate synthase
MGDGEAAKSLATVESLCRELAAWGLLRGDAVVALGGGVVGDTAGFAAATYHRGVAVAQVPTTLLAQVDAAIGGKTAVNLPEGKNLVGAFHQPRVVVADVVTLATLPAEELRAGLGEVAKYSLMPEGTTVRALVEERAGAIVARDADALVDVVAECARIKAAVVADDPDERSGRRATLNYGHTLGHALEAVGRYGLRHGEAVAIGLVFADSLAHALGRLDRHEVDRHRALVRALDLPDAVPSAVADGDVLLASMRRDKKAKGGLTFVLPGPSGLELVDDPPPDALDAAFAAVGVRAGARD